MRRTWTLKLCYFTENNFYLPEKVQDIIREKLYWKGNKVGCDVANSYGDLWYLLSKNVENFDKIHLFSSEIQKIPEAVKRFFREKNSDNSWRYHFTGSSIEGYISKVNSVINNLLEKIKDDREFIVQNKQEEIVQIKEENKFLRNNDTNLPEYKKHKK